MSFWTFLQNIINSLVTGLFSSQKFKYFTSIGERFLKLLIQVRPQLMLALSIAATIGGIIGGIWAVFQVWAYIKKKYTIVDFEIINRRIRRKKWKFPEKHARRFYEGTPVHWKDIASNLDVPRKQTPDICTYAKSCANLQERKISLILITAPAGSGKETIMRRVGRTLSEDKSCIVVELAHSSSQFGEKLITLQKRFKEKPIYVLIDDLPLNHRNFVKVIDFLHGKMQENPIIFIATARTNEWEVVSQKTFHPEFYELKKFEIENLTDAEIDELLKKLTRYKMLGELKNLPPSEQRANLIKAAKRQLLVALLEATHGEKFESIIESIYTRIENIKEEAAYAYASINFLFNYGLFTPQSLLEALTNLSRIKFYFKVLMPCKGEIIKKLQWGERYLGSRHELIAETLVRRIIENKGDWSDYFNNIIELAAPESKSQRNVIINLLERVLFKIKVEEKEIKQFMEEKRRRVREVLKNNKNIQNFIYEAEAEKNVIELNRWGNIHKKYGLSRRALQCFQKSVNVYPLNPISNLQYIKLLPRSKTGIFKDLMRTTVAFEKNLQKEKNRIRKNYLEINYINFLEIVETRWGIRQKVTVLKKALEVNPENIKTRYVYAEALRSLNTVTSLKRAFIQYRKVDELQYKKKGYHHHMALKRCGDTLKEVGEMISKEKRMETRAKKRRETEEKEEDYFELADSFYQKVLENCKEDDERLIASVKNDRARLFHLLGKDDEAEKLWREDIIPNYPNFPWGPIGFGWFGFITGRLPLDQSIKHISKGINISKHIRSNYAAKVGEEKLSLIKEEVGSKTYKNIIESIKKRDNS